MRAPPIPASPSFFWYTPILCSPLVFHFLPMVPRLDHCGFYSQLPWFTLLPLLSLTYKTIQSRLWCSLPYCKYLLVPPPTDNKPQRCIKYTSNSKPEYSTSIHCPVGLFVFPCTAKTGIRKHSVRHKKTIVQPQYHTYFDASPFRYCLSSFLHSTSLASTFVLPRPQTRKQKWWQGL